MFSRVIAALFLIIGLWPAALAAEDPAGWKLVWQDEFDGPKLDYTKWAVEENAHGGGNNELQFYTDRPANVRVENGSLSRTAHGRMCWTGGRAAAAGAAEDG